MWGNTVLEESISHQGLGFTFQLYHLLATAHWHAYLLLSLLLLAAAVYILKWHHFCILLSYILNGLNWFVVRWCHHADMIIKCQLGLQSSESLSELDLQNDHTQGSQLVLSSEAPLGLWTEWVPVASLSAVGRADGLWEGTVWEWMLFEEDWWKLQGRKMIEAEYLNQDHITWQAQRQGLILDLLTPEFLKYTT